MGKITGFLEIDKDDRRLTQVFAGRVAETKLPLIFLNRIGGQVAGCNLGILTKKLLAINQYFLYFLALGFHRSVFFHFNPRHFL